MVDPESKKKRKFEEVPFVVKLVTAGTAACMADLVTFPLDTAKVRLQIQGERLDEASGQVQQRYRNVYHTISTIVKEEGFRGLYNGLTAGLQRQMCFASVRIGMYDSVKTFYQSKLYGEKEMTGWLDILTRIGSGITTGALAVIFAQPTDIVKVRFQAQSGNEKRYKSTREAYKTIYKFEGVRGLWKGMYPNIARNAIVNVSEIVCYDLVKSSILKNKILQDNTLCHFTSAVIAGFFTTVVSSPVDVIKTRYMNSKPTQYKNAMDCAIKTAKLEGVKAFYKGFTPSFYRLVAWNIVLWVSYEKLKLLAVRAYNDR